MVSEQQPHGGGGRAPRADAQRNRGRLVEAAREGFSKHGTEASLEDIARQAGVGIGTLYRHFPTRDALIEAVYRREVEVLHGAAGELLATRPPDEALAEWMQRFVGYVATKRGLASALKSMMDANATLFEDCRQQLLEAAGKLLGAAAAAQLVRSDVAPGDLLRAMSGICLATDQAQWVDHSRPLVALLLDGLRYGAAPRSA